MDFSQNISFYNQFLKARLHIGYIAYPYTILGFLLHWSLLSFNPQPLLADNGANFLRFLYATILSFLYLPYVFIVNDYFDAPFDAIDEKKRNRNPFCSEDLKHNNGLRLLLISPAIICLILSYLISWQALIATILALLLGTYYSARPFRFKERPIADFMVHGFCLGLYFYALGFFAIWIQNYDPFSAPLFLIFLVFAFADAAWVQFDSQLVDYYIDLASKQKTSSVILGPKIAIFILRSILVIILSVPVVFFLFLPGFIQKFGIFFTLMISGLLLVIPISYIIHTQLNITNMERIRYISSRYRVYSVYLISIISIILIEFIQII